MAAQIVQLAEAVTDFLNSASFSQVFTAERRNRVREDLSAVQDLNVWVVPAILSSEVHSRRDDLVDFGIQVAVVRESVEDDEIDDMLFLMDQLSQALTHENFDPFQYAGQVNTPIYSPERIDNEGIFLSVITVTYKAIRGQNIVTNSLQFNDADNSMYLPLVS